MQGEVQELELESLLGSAFVYDTIARVPKGEFGGDVLPALEVSRCGPRGYRGNFELRFAPQASV